MYCALYYESVHKKKENSQDRDQYGDRVPCFLYLVFHSLFVFTFPFSLLYLALFLVLRKKLLFSPCQIKQSVKETKSVFVAWIFESFLKFFSLVSFWVLLTASCCLVKLKYTFSQFMFGCFVSYNIMRNWSSHIVFCPRKLCNRIKIFTLDFEQMRRVVLTVRRSRVEKFLFDSDKCKGLLFNLVVIICLSFNRHGVVKKSI